MGAAIQFESVSKRFVLERDRPRSFKEAFVGALRRGREPVETLMALDDVSFELPRGGSLGFVGPNGTGKSTSLKLIARILEPTSGRVVVDGRVAALLELGAGFHPDLTGRENVYLNGSMMGFGRREMDARLDRIVDFSELGRFVEMPVKHYSSGMYMRLGFATAIHLDAEILLIDEVLAVGDQAFQHKCRDRIAKLRRSGVSIALVSHDNAAIRELCDNTLWLEDGQARAFGPTDAVIEAYYASMVAREETRLHAERLAAGQEEDGASSDEPEPEPDRWGSREVEILDLELLGPYGQPREIVLTGQPMTLRLHYLAHRRVEGPVFGIAIHREDGLHINGPNTRDADFEIEAIEGPGFVDYEVERLALMSGRYELSAAVYDEAAVHAFDHHQRRFELRVRAGRVGEQYGLVHMPAHWSHQTGEAPSKRMHAPDSKVDADIEAKPASSLESQSEDPGPGDPA
jgi:lipopolysaccharide transport system ATP-binding protein